MAAISAGGRDGPADSDDRPPTGDAADEVATLLRAQSDLRLFEPLYRRYHRPVFEYCYRRLGHTERAADATSQVFTKALAGIHGFRSGSVAAWLFTIARNTVIDAVRTHRPNLGLDDADMIADPKPLPDELVIAAEERHRLRAALDHLSPDQRAIVELRWAGLTGPEIAQTLGLRLAATKSAQLRAYASLRALLGPDHGKGDTR